MRKNCSKFSGVQCDSQLSGTLRIIAFDLVISFLGLYPKEVIKDKDKDLCTRMIKSYKQLKYTKIEKFPDK
jgi:hypothetical protein